MRQHADVAVVVQQRAAILGPAAQQVAAEEQGLIRPPQQTKDSSRHIQRAAELGDAARARDDRRAGNQQRDFVGVNGNALLAIDPGAVVGHHDKEGIGPEGLLPRGLEKAAQGVVGVFHGVFAPPLIRVLGDLALRIGVRLVIRDGEDSAAERLTGLRQLAELVHPAEEEVLVAHAPDGGEGRMLEMLLLDETVVAVADGEGAHAVEQPAAAIEEYACVAVPLQHAGDGLDIVGPIPLDDRLTGQRREGGQCALEPPHGTVAGSIEVREEHAFLGRELVHLRCECVGAAQAAPELGAEALLEEDHHVEAGAGRIAGDAPADRLARFHKLRVRFGQEAARPLVGFSQRHGLVERGVIKVMRPSGSEEGEGAVIGDFVQGAVVAHVHALEIHGRNEQSGECHRGRQMQQPGLGREGPLPHLPKEAAGRE